MRGYLQATLEECRKALASHNTGLHARERVDEARTFMGETACTVFPFLYGSSVSQKVRARLNVVPPPRSSLAPVRQVSGGLYNGLFYQKEAAFPKSAGV